MLPMTSPAALLERYGTVINRHRFDDIAPLIAEDAVFWFNDGSFRGSDAIGAAFERTWARYPDEQYGLDDVTWIAVSADAAACLYRFRWTATVDGRPASGGGRGTTVMKRQPDGWRIVHEHLSAEPPVLNT